MKRFAGAFAFIGAVIIGFGFFVSTFEYQQKRSTASLKNSYDLTCLSGEELQKAITAQIVMGFKGVRRDGYLGINIGHYTYSDSEADKKAACPKENERSISSSFALVPKKMACEIYPKLKLKFIADGESANGDKREMDVETGCTVSADMARTEIAWIPWSQLAKETPFEGESKYSKPSQVTVKTKNITDQWPKKWILNQIQLEGDSGMVTVNASEIETIAKRTIVFEFN